jgi:hypothetical protein
MNLDTVHAILAATTEQPYGFLKIGDANLEPEVREMAEAGLITATLRDGKTNSFTAVNGVTESGLQFLRVFRRHRFSPRTPIDRRNMMVPFGRPTVSVP